MLRLADPGMCGMLRAPGKRGGGAVTQSGDRLPTPQLKSTTEGGKCKTGFYGGLKGHPAPEPYPKQNRVLCRRVGHGVPVVGFVLIPSLSIRITASIIS